MGRGFKDEAVVAEPRDRSDIDIDEIKSLIRDFYGLEIVAARALGGEIDHNLCVTDAHGQRFLAKLAPASSTPAVVEWQESVLEHLAQRPISVEFPRILQNCNGQVHCNVVVGDGEYLLRLLTWIDGGLMADLDEQPRGLLHQLGFVAAEITQALEGLQQPEGVNAHHWLVTRSREAIEASMDAVTDPDCQGSVDTIMNWFQEAATVFGRLPLATVHQDLNDFNVLVTVPDSGEARVAGVLDFNDAVTTIRVAELAIAGAYAMLRKSDPVRAFCDVVAGYREVISMTDEELDVVFPLAAARLCVNAATWTKRTSLENHRYGEARKQATWPTVLAFGQDRPRRSGVEDPPGPAGAKRTHGTDGIS